MTREQAIKLLTQYIDYDAETPDYYKMEEACKVAIKALEQEPKTGHWIKGYTFPDGEYWKCDKCNELIKVKYPMNYCNNCGSDNREVEDGKTD